LSGDNKSANQTIDNLPALLSVQKISKNGLVTLEFSKEVLVLKNHTVLFDEGYYDKEMHRNLELIVLKDNEN